MQKLHGIIICFQFASATINSAGYFLLKYVRIQNHCKIVVTKTVTFLIFVQDAHYRYADITQLYEDLPEGGTIATCLEPGNRVRRMEIPK